MQTIQNPQSNFSICCSKILCIMLFALFWVGNVSAQIECGVPSIEQIGAENLPMFNKLDQGLIQTIKYQLKPQTGNSTPPPAIPQNVILGSDQVVPVVFHLIGNTAFALTDAQVNAALQKLNNDFNPAILSSVPGAARPRIKFCLATIPPVGKAFNSTSLGINRFAGSNLLTFNQKGINYTRSYDHIANHLFSQSFFGSPCYTPGDFMSAYELGNIENYDPEKYVNIYVVSAISKIYEKGCNCCPSCTTAAQLTACPCSSAQCKFFDKFVNNIGGFANFWPDEIFVVRADAISNPNSDILAHEAGHFLSLMHTFEGGYTLNSVHNNNTTPCDYSGDRCCDTPPVFNNSNTGNLGVNCSIPGTTTNTVKDNYFSGGGDRNDMIENYMDYSDDNCKNTFTTDQVLRMKYTLLYYRNKLSTGVNLVDVGAISCASVNTVFSEFTPFQSGTTILKEIGCVNNDVFEFKGVNNSSYTYTWSILPNTFTGTLSGFNPTGISFTAAGHYTISLTCTRPSGSGTISSTTSSELIISNCTAINNERSNWYFGYLNSLSFSTGIAKVAPASLPATKALVVV
jgi:Pregnancy-associated plasma protein-A